MDNEVREKVLQIRISKEDLQKFKKACFKKKSIMSLQLRDFIKNFIRESEVNE